jgi:hypothetical protein
MTGLFRAMQCRDRIGSGGKTICSWLLLSHDHFNGAMKRLDSALAMQAVLLALGMGGLRHDLWRLIASGEDDGRGRSPVEPMVVEP